MCSHAKDIWRRDPERSLASVPRALSPNHYGEFLDARMWDRFSGWRGGRPWKSSGLLESPAQNVLNLRVQAAQLIRCPTLESDIHRRIEPQQEWFALRHCFS